MGLNINGKVIIYKNTYGYSTAISNKNQEGQYDKMYVSVQLPKGAELENKTLIDITKGFLSFYKTKEGLPKLKLVIQEWEFIGGITQQNDFIGTSDDLPF